MNVTPKILDKKDQPEKVTQDQAIREQTQERKKDVPMICHRKTWTDSDGVFHDEMSEPIPVSEWAEYEKEHKL